MKVIDLLNKIANGEVPKKIKVDREIYEWDILEHFYKKYNGDDLLELSTMYSTYELLNMNVELIEDNTIDIDSIEEFSIPNCIDEGMKMILEKQNESIKAVKQLNKEIKELKNKHLKER